MKIHKHFKIQTIIACLPDFIILFTKPIDSIKRWDISQSIYLIKKYLEYLILLNINYIVIFFSPFHHVKLKFKFKCNIVYVSREPLVDFKVRGKIHIILLKFKRGENILLKYLKKKEKYANVASCIW